MNGVHRYAGQRITSNETYTINGNRAQSLTSSVIRIFLKSNFCGSGKGA